MTVRLKRVCVIGWPVAHSRSPLIHGHWLDRYGIDGAYEREAVAPKDLPAFLAGLHDRGYAGANVTLPHKEEALRLAHRADEAAAAIGAANTLWYEHGRLHAGNTDAYGFMTHLADTAPAWHAQQRPVVLLGAGGAARAVLFGLLHEGVTEIRLLNRTRTRAEALARRFDARVRTHDWGEREAVLADAGLLVNTTTLGMVGGPPLALGLAAMPRDAVVADIVYTPLETPLLAQARAEGLQAVDGLGMLLHQAAPGFERWFGVRPEVTDALRRKVEASLEEKPC